MTAYHTHFTDAPPDAARHVIVQGLLAHNRERTGLSDHRPLAVLLRDDAGEVIGGLWGRTAYRWLFVELLFVPEALRGRRVGAELLAGAEQEARHRGCIGSWLDTFEFQARGFYERQGYGVFGEIGDYPPGFARYYLSKRFGDGA
ncbi:GNAT family N-acetyltransferase [Variovorax sp.]|jgi:GNAT superfamily N-acetyltransferase|uniref:GNAT family N-acetyltransferase n=1 Tax=Variovorax TaxID=34072 RepID=UPI00137D1102|nr:GNAT family N-acetyltransferase [Variovorax sp.]KAF1067395.1 MAG: Acetyltransferase [Variovorax sp.]